MKWIITLLMSASLAWAGKVLITWDSNPPHENVLGYKAYEVWTNEVGAVTNSEFLYFISPTNTWPTNLADSLTNYVILPNVPGGNHTFVVTATNAWGESDFSEDASIWVPLYVPRKVKVELLPEDSTDVTLKLDTNHGSYVISESADMQDWAPLMDLVIYDTETAKAKSVTFDMLTSQDANFFKGDKR